MLPEVRSPRGLFVIYPNKQILLTQQVSQKLVASVSRLRCAVTTKDETPFPLV